MTIEDRDIRVLNFCQKDTISVCTAKEGEQEWCEFFKKSRFKNKCMYFIFDEYCDCLKAQMDNEKWARRLKEI